MVPYIPEVLVRERHQRYVEEAARYRRVSQSGAHGRAGARLTVARALVTAGQRLVGQRLVGQRLTGRALADRAMAGRPDWTDCSAPDAAGGR